MANQPLPVRRHRQRPCRASAEDPCWPAPCATAGHEVLDLGTYDAGPGRLPRLRPRRRRAVEAGQARFGVLVCGSGVGMSIAANRHPGIRCVLASEPLTATLSRAHNDANVLALGARLIGEDMALAILRAFLAGRFEGGRHDRAPRQAHPVPEGTPE